MNEAIAATAPATSPVAKTRPGHVLIGWVLHNVVWIWLVALVVLFGSFNEFFLTVFNLQNIMVQATVLLSLIHI